MDVKSGQDYLFYEEVGKIGPLTEILEDMYQTILKTQRKSVSEIMLTVLWHLKIQHRIILKIYHGSEI